MADVEDYCKDTFTLNTDKLLHAIKFRRSIRDYKAQPVENEKLQKLRRQGATPPRPRTIRTATLSLCRRNLLPSNSRYGIILKNILFPMPEIFPTKCSLTFPLTAGEKQTQPTITSSATPRLWFISPPTGRWMPDLPHKNMELMAVSMGLGVLYNGFLARISDENESLKTWLGIEGKRSKPVCSLDIPTFPTPEQHREKSQT